MRRIQVLSQAIKFILPNMLHFLNIHKLPSISFCLYYIGMTFVPIKVAGWGLTTTQGTAANILQVLEMPFINVDTCINTLPQSFREYITGDKFCAGFTSGGYAFSNYGLKVYCHHF